MTVIELDQRRRNPRRKKSKLGVVKKKGRVSLQRTMLQVQYLGIATGLAFTVFFLTLTANVLNGPLFKNQTRRGDT